MSSYILSRVVVLSVLDSYKQPVQNLAQLVLLLSGKLSGQRISVYIGAEVNKKAEGGCVVCWHMRITRPLRRGTLERQLVQKVVQLCQIGFCHRHALQLAKAVSVVNACVAMKGAGVKHLLIFKIDMVIVALQLVHVILL